MEAPKPIGNSFVRFCPVNEIQAGSLSPHLITGLLLRNLREHFRKGGVEDRNLANLYWVGKKNNPVVMDDTRSTMVIEPDDYDKKIVAGANARIIIQQQEYSNEIMGVGDNRYHGDWASIDGMIAGMVYSDPIFGSHVISCQGPAKAFAQLLSWEVYRHLHQFRHLWVSHYGFSKFGVKKVGPAQDLQDSKGYGVDVTLEYSFTDNYVVAEVAPTFQGVTMNLKQD